MEPSNSIPILTEEEWIATPEQVAEELRSFVTEFDSFTPEWFAEVKFHLLRHDGLNKESRDELCAVSIFYKTCPKCDSLYKAKKCLLWYRLFKLITEDTIRRAPPCIRRAYSKKSIKTVANYLVRANLIAPPFYKIQNAPSCKIMRRWGYCDPDEYCKAMETETTLAYNAARERVKLSRNFD